MFNVKRYWSIYPSATSAVVDIFQENKLKCQFNGQARLQAPTACERYTRQISTSEGQFGVASVIYNRLQAGAAGGVSDSLSGVVTPGNFNGYNSNPSSYAQQLANDIWNGNAPSGGSTGNALYFAAPSTSNAAWANPNTASGQGLFANGTNLGGNYYSDQMGPPSVNFQAPSFGGAVVPSMAALIQLPEKAVSLPTLLAMLSGEQTQMAFSIILTTTFSTVGLPPAVSVPTL